MEFDIARFNPTIKELNDLKDKYENVKINWIDDKENYELCKYGKRVLSSKRNKIKKTLKRYRQEALDYQKFIIREEKKILDIILTTENNLVWEIEKVDNENLKIKKAKYLPNRYKILKLNNLICDDEDLLLSFDWDWFLEYVNSLIEIKKETEQQMIIEEAIQFKIDAEDKILDDMKREEKEAKDKKYQSWLIENEYDEDTDIIEYENWTKVLYRKVSTYENTTIWWLSSNERKIKDLL